MEDDELEIRYIQAGDHVAGLSLGDQAFVPLKTYLKRDAKIHHELSLARTYCVFRQTKPQKVLAYITLICGEIRSEDVPDDAAANQHGAEFNYDHYPAIKIARLAVDKSIKGYKVGTKLIELALGTAKNVSTDVGCRFLVVESKRQSLGFYKKVGFTMLDTPANKKRNEPMMFVDLLKV